MEIWQAIRDDHARFDALFEEIENAEEPEARARLVAELMNGLEAHAQGEEKAVYPALEKLSDLAERISESRDEHEEMRKLLKRIVAADADEQLDLLSELEDLVQDHVEEEEDEVIPVAEKAIGEDDAREMLRRFESAKKAAVRS